MEAQCENSAMPARSNEFQKLIYLVKHNLAAGAVVTESKMLVDLVAGDEVEVDVVIEGQIGSDPILISVECRDHSRRADKGWVNEMKAKHDRLPTHALILASRKGFSRRAMEVARSYGIETVSLDEVNEADFPAVLGKQISLWAKSVTVSAQRVHFALEAADNLPAERVAVSPNTLLFGPNGESAFSTARLVSLALNSPQVRDLFLSQGTPESKWFDVEWETPSGADGKKLPD